MRCVVCKKEAEIKILAPFCSQCFITHYQRRVERVIKRWQLISKNERILVCVSGGKDSLSCAEVLYQLKDRFQFELAVLHLDVNFFRCANERTKKVVEKFCTERNIPFYFTSFKEYLHIEKIEKIFEISPRPRCGTCGLLKRYIFNKFARENNFAKIATGHCADDIIKFFFKNFESGYFDWTDKLKPLTPSFHPKVVARIRPLYLCLEIENYAYIKFKNIEIATCSLCSYFTRKDKWDEIFRFIDEKRPQFKLNFVRNLAEVEIKGRNQKEKELKECEICGEITDRDICALCNLKLKLTKKNN
jgi:tRNA(Ile)-lysidine synthase TilS/MesJ|uniref:Adenine nucleotide alpha hydrolase family protein n=1 Tax=candidate division WOR-3 bacterium TaxID=2052148 RepID=A0A7V5Y062_UNCW3